MHFHGWKVEWSHRLGLSLPCDVHRLRRDRPGRLIREWRHLVSTVTHPRSGHLACSLTALLAGEAFTCVLFRVIFKATCMCTLVFCTKIDCLIYLFIFIFSFKFYLCSSLYIFVNKQNCILLDFKLSPCSECCMLSSG
jgi:hypothetical protein